MNKTPLTEEIQAIILTVQDYARFLRHYHMSVLKNQNFDWWNETEKFYISLKDKLPEGMNTCLACFEAVMSYKIDKTIDTLFEELPKKFTFSF
jgi:two-component SAPR family response regulator